MAVHVSIAPGRRMCLDFVYPIREYGVALEWLHNIGVVTSV